MGLKSVQNTATSRLLTVLSAVNSHVLQPEGNITLIGCAPDQTASEKEKERQMFGNMCTCLSMTTAINANREEQEGKIDQVVVWCLDSIRH